MQTAQVIQLEDYRPLTPAQKLNADKETLRKTIRDEKLNFLSQILIEATPVAKPDVIETTLITIKKQLDDLLQDLKSERGL